MEAVRKGLPYKNVDSRETQDFLTSEQQKEDLRCFMQGESEQKESKSPQLQTRGGEEYMLLKLRDMDRTDNAKLRNYFRRYKGSLVHLKDDELVIERNVVEEEHAKDFIYIEPVVCFAYSREFGTTTE